MNQLLGCQRGLSGTRTSQRILSGSMGTEVHLLSKWIFQLMWVYKINQLQSSILTAACPHPNDWAFSGFSISGSCFSWTRHGTSLSIQVAVDPRFRGSIPIMWKKRYVCFFPAHQDSLSAIHTHLKGICTICCSECCYGLIVSIRMESTQSFCGQPQTVMLPDSLALIPLEN